MRLCVSVCVVVVVVCACVCVNDLKLVCRIPLDLIAGELLVRSDSKIVFIPGRPFLENLKVHIIQLFYLFLSLIGTVFFFFN